MTQLLSGSSAIAGVVMGEGYPGKIPELMTIYQTGTGALPERALGGGAEPGVAGSYGYRYTAKPTCILYNDVRCRAPCASRGGALTRGARRNTRRCWLRWETVAATRVRCAAPPLVSQRPALSACGRRLSQRKVVPDDR